MLTRLLSAGALAGALMFSAAGAADAAVVGSVAGPDNSSSLTMTFTNTGPTDILQINIDSGDAASSFVWTNAGMTFDTTAAIPGVSGIGTSLLSFSWDLDEFITADVFGALLVTVPTALVSDLIGVVVSVVFEDNSVFVGRFVDNPATGAGLVLTAIPLPTALPLLASGLVGLVFLARRRERRQPITA